MTELIILITASVSILAFYQPQLMHQCIFNPYHVQQSKEYYRFLTSGFLHANWMHLLINMLVLWSFGQGVEKLYGYHFGQAARFYYITLYIGAIFISELPTFLKHKNEPQYASLGASGAVSAVVFAMILFRPWNKVYLMGIFPLPGIAFGILYLIYSAQMAQQSRDNINHDAHFYGAVFGLVFTIILKPTLAIGFLNQLLSVFG